MFRRRVVTACLVVGAALACDEPVKPPTTGSIAVVIVSASNPQPATTGDSAGVSSVQSAEAGSAGILALEAARVTVSGGPTPKTVTSTTPSGGNFDITVSGLGVGSYTVTVEGLNSNEVTYYGSTANVSVTAGVTATATVPLPAFVPTLSDLPASTTTIMTLVPTWTTISNASGYVIQVADNAAFNNQAEKTVTGTSVTNTNYNVTALGTTYVRVRAVKDAIRSAPSAVKQINLVREANDTSDLAIRAVDLGFGVQATPINRFAQNIAPLGDVDWFMIKICSADSLIVGARAVRLTPASSLNTLLQLFDSTGAGTPLVTSDNADSTDAQIRYLSLASGRYRLRVSAAAGTAGSAAVGHYDAVFSFWDGPKNTGTACRSSVEVTPSSPTIGALGGTRQMTAQLLDSDGNTINGATFAWNSSNTGVATVDPTTGLVTAVTNGSTNVTATSAGISSSPIALTVQQVVSLVPVTPGGATITTLGGTEDLSAQAQDANGNIVPGKTITWGTLNPAVATVNPTTGTVTAVTSGQATISATSDGASGYGVVTVAPPTATPVNDWSTDNSGTTSSLRGIFGFSETDAFAVGNDGTILRYNGSTWTPMTSGTAQSLLAVWGSSSTNVFAVGGAGTILRFNGTSWTPMTSPVTSLLWGVWGAGPDAVFAVGNAGTILRYDGTAWTSMTSGTSDVLHGVWGSSATNVFAVGNGGTIIRYNGTSWSTPMPNPSTEDLWGVWGFSPTEVYAAGLNGTILKYNGTSWATMTSGTGTNLRDIWGTSGSDLYAVGDGGTVLRHDGNNWGSLSSGTTALLEGVWGTQAIHSVFGVGSSGTIAHGQRLGVVDHVVVTPPTATLTAIDATVQLTAEARDPSNNLLSGRTFAWNSTNEAAATVDAAGLVTAVANGTTLVIATTAGKSDTTEVTVAQVIETVEVSPTDATVGVGSSAQFSAVGRDVNGHVVPGAAFTWSTSDDQNATVDVSGLVTALNGTATITATSGNGKQGSGTVTASVVAVATVTVAPAGGTIAVSGTIQLTATTRDGANNILTGRAIVWSSNLPNIADVDADGLVTGYGQGDAVITATSEGHSGTSNITVSGTVVTSVVVTPSPNTLTAIGNTVQLSAEARDPGNNPVGGKVFTWVSQAPAVATVDADGLVTAVGAGTVNITATTDGVSGNGAITVAQDVATVEVVPATGNVGVSQSSQLSLIVKDANANVIASPPAAIWSTLDPDIATVSPSGLVGAASVGTTTITATISGHSGSSEITVVATPVATVEVTPAPTTVGEGQTVQLTATPKDGGGVTLTERVISWSSNSPNATVDAAGLVTGVIPGTATITATSEGQNGTSLVTITARTVNSIVVTPRGATVVVPGGTQQFTAEALDNLTQVIPGKVFTWASLNNSVATVDPSNGVASVLANGQVTVSASVDGKTGYGLLTAAPEAAPVNLWNPETNTSNTLKGVWGSSASNIIAVGGTAGSSAIRRFDGSNWGAMTTGATVILEGVWGTGTNNIFAVGAGGTILQSTDGSSWTGMTSNTSQPLHAVWGSSPTVVYAVGAAGTIMRYTGTSWGLVTPVTSRELYAIWGAANNDIWAVGNEGRVLRFNGTNWTETIDGSENLRGVWGTATNNVFTVSASGTIRHWNGSIWEASGTTGGAALNGIYGSSSTDAYAVGASGTIMRWDGVNWTAMISGTSSELFGTWSRSGRVVSVGATGEIHRGFRGATVLVSPADPVFVTLETNQTLTAEARDAQNNPIPGRTFTWGTANNLIADVDAGGQVTAKGAGSTAITATTGGLSGNTDAVVAQVATSVVVTPGSPTLTAFGATVQLVGEARDAGTFLIPGATFLWETSDDQIATVSNSGLVQAVGNGPVTITATRNAAPGTANITVGQVTASIAVTPAGAQTTGAMQAYAAQALDANGFVIDGTSFTWSGLNDAIATVDAGGVATPVASGQMLVKAEVDGVAGYGVLTVSTPAGAAANAWAAVSTTASDPIRGIWGANTNDIHVVGANGMIRRYTGTWGSPTSPTGVDLAGIWGSAADNIYAVGGAAEIIRFDGANWNDVPGVPGSDDLTEVWGSSPSDIFAVGTNGVVLHFDGTDWTESHPVAAALSGVWGTARNDVWAVGTNGTVAHYDGSVWAVENPVAEDLYAVWGTSPTNVWAVGASGRIIRYTGTWSPVTSPTDQALLAIWGSAADDIYAVDGAGNIIRYNGVDWLKTGQAPGVVLEALFGIGSAAYAGVSSGDVLAAYRGTTLAVTPPSQTLTILGATQDLTEEIDGGAITGVPVVWTSSDPYVATVDPSTGVVTAVGRGSVTIAATAAGGASGAAQITVTAIRVLRIRSADPGAEAANSMFSSGDLVGSITTTTDFATFNGASAASLRASYDVLLFGYAPSASFDLDWNGKLLPFLNLGGGLVTEDYVNTGATEWGAITTIHPPSNPCGTNCSVLADVPGLTSAPGVPITATFTAPYNLNTFSNFPGMTAFLGVGIGGTSTPPVAGIYGKFGTGCIVMNAPVNDYWGVRPGGGDAVSNNMYNLLLNSLTWAADCPLTAEVGPPASVVVAPNGAILTSYGQTRQFTAQVFDAVGNAITSPTITWESSDEAILSIDQTGLVQAIAGNGIVTVTATAAGGTNPSDAVTVGINQPTATLTVSPEGASITGGTQAFTATARNSNGDILTNKVFTWGVRNAAVATMSGGTATAVASGQTQVSAAVDGKIAYSVLTVAIPPSTQASIFGLQSGTGASNFYGVWGTAFNNQYAVGAGNTILRYNGSAWSAPMATPAAVAGYAFWAGVWGTSNSDIFTGGQGGALLHYDGVNWTEMTGSRVVTTNYLYRIWGSSPTNIYAVGDGGVVLRYNGTAWSVVAGVPAAVARYGIWGSAANDVYAVGFQGSIVHYDGTTWTDVPHGQGTGFHLYGVWGTGSDNVYAVGDGGKILRCTGGSCAAGTGWTTVSAPAVTGWLWTVTGTAADEVYATGINGVFRFDGVSWTAMTITSPTEVRSLFGNSANDLMGVGGAGRIWRGMRNPTPTSFGNGVLPSAGGGPGNAWAYAISVASKTELRTLSAYMATAAAGGMMIGIYSDNGLVAPLDAPATKLAETGIFAIAGGAANYTAPIAYSTGITPASQIQLLPGKYWLVLTFENAGSFYYDISGGLGYRYGTYTWGPANLPSSNPTTASTQAGYRFGYSGGGFLSP